VLTVAGGWGVWLYGLTWALLVFRHDPPVWREPSERDDPLRILAVALVVAGALLILRAEAFGFADELVWPVAIVALGLSFLWHRLDLDAERSAARVTALRVLGGLILVAGGLGFLLAANLSFVALRDGLVAAGIVLAGTLLMFAPSAFRISQSLVEERRGRIRADERAELAAHLHDSVLQTLTLIQKRASEPQVMAALARQQERELRRWLYGQPEVGDDRRFRDELDAIVAEVEDQHLVTIDNVTVGDAMVDAPLRGLLAATREALLNAATWSGERTIALYAEVGVGAVEVFVRDRGAGFDVDRVGPDRRGISESIVGRMTRLGGTADVRSRPCEGTEVHLLLPWRVE